MDNPNPQNDDPDLTSDPHDEEMIETNFNHLPDGSMDEETAAELGTIDYDDSLTRDDDQDESSSNVNSIVGWVGLALSIVSFFFLPIVLGGAGIVVGFIARSRDSAWLGSTAIAAGVISIILTLFIIPFV